MRVKQVTLARKPGPQKKSCPWKKPMQCGDIMDLMDCPNDANSLIGANPGSVILPVRTIPSSGYGLSNCKRATTAWRVWKVAFLQHVEEAHFDRFLASTE